MDKKEKHKDVSENEAKKCECGCGGGPDCKCGCQDGGKCTCGCGCGCGCKKKLFKLLAALIIFFAGVGVGCFICCSFCHNQPRLRSVKMPVSAFDRQAGNVIIINTDGKNGMPEIMNHNKGNHCNKHHGKHSGMHNFNPAVNQNSNPADEKL